MFLAEAFGSQHLSTNTDFVTFFPPIPREDTKNLRNWEYLWSVSYHATGMYIAERQKKILAPLLSQVIPGKDSLSVLFLANFVQGIMPNEIRENGLRK